MDSIAHLAFGAESWAAQLAGYAAERGILFCSRVRRWYFSTSRTARIADDPRTAQDDYGFYKIRCAEAIRASSPAACIVRLGWQIDPDARGNNMLAALNAQQASDGCIRASTRWRPACSFMADTVAALRMLFEVPVAETVHLDSNARQGYSFAELVSALRTTYGCEHWVLNQTADYVHYCPPPTCPPAPDAPL